MVNFFDLDETPTTEWTTTRHGDPMIACECRETRLVIKINGDLQKPYKLCIFRGDKAEFRNFAYETRAHTAAEKILEQCVKDHQDSGNPFVA